MPKTTSRNFAKILKEKSHSTSNSTFSEKKEPQTAFFDYLQDSDKKINDDLIHLRMQKPKFTK